MATLGVSFQANAALTDGLVAHWSFDDCTAKDNSGNGHNGVISGSLQCSDSSNGKALYFDGTGSVITIPSSQSLKIDNNITISAIVSADQSSSSIKDNDGIGIINKGKSGIIWDYMGLRIICN